MSFMSMGLPKNNFLCYNYYRVTKKLVDETISKIKNLSNEDKLKQGQFRFIHYLLSRPELSYQEINTLSLSLLTDGLSAVSIN